ncbi:MAG: peptidoglycan DD-metalloendopeptidase family protein [Pseudoxanthomonas sp.]|nr:peptidoglycan DD-metalloendopeptidase family protein [Pseudoxanthomonas sp.]
MTGRAVACLAMLAVLAGCMETRVAVVRTSAGGAAPAPAIPASTGGHQVARGETLYSIAFRNGLDWRDLAAWNGLAAPYTIFPGQRLRLAPGGAGTAVAAGPGTRPVAAGGGQPRAPAPPPGAAPPAASAPPAGQPPDPDRIVPVTADSPPPRPVDATPAAGQAAPAPASGRTPEPVPAPAPTAPVAAVPPRASVGPPPGQSTQAPIPGASAAVAGIRWRWPTQGEVIKRFSDGDLARQGIHIAGRSGQAVVAAADGEVVYSGSGLRGYGELIIVKHSPEFLSAYGHNRVRLVNEGQRVQAGQPIAEMGRTGADRDKLHFEIRRNGRPVDPQQFLPRR